MFGALGADVLVSVLLHAAFFGRLQHQREHGRSKVLFPVL